MKFNMSYKSSIIVILLAFSFLCVNSSYAFDPDAVKSYNQGVDFSKSGNYQEAVLMFRKAVTIDPSFTDAYYNLGSLYEYLGNNDKALQSYEELVKRDSSDDEAAYKVGSIYFQKNNFRKAISYLILISPGSEKYTDAQKLMKRANIKISEAISPRTSSQKLVQKVPQKQIHQMAQKSVKTTKNEITKVVIKDFSGPTGIATDSKNNLYVANYIENSVVQIAPNGTRKVLAKDNPISGPIGLAVDTAGNIYVASYLSNEVVKMSPQGKIISVLKGINKPYYIYIDKTGTLYISEQGTNTVIKLKM